MLEQPLTTARYVNTVYMLQWQGWMNANSHTHFTSLHYTV